MLRLGCHLSIAKGLDKTAKMAGEVRANTFQYFTRNPRGGAARKISEEEIKLWKEVRAAENLYPIVGHLPYVVNLATPKEGIHKFASKVLLEDLERMEAIGAEYLVVHPGSHLGEGKEKGIYRIIKALEESLLQFSGKTSLLLETMAGQGSEVGSLKDIRAIMEGLGNPESLGVCLDSCHLFAAGYDFRSSQGLEILIEEIHEMFGLDKVKVFHLNDCKFPLGSKKDRHERLGQGYIKKEGFLNILSNPAFQEVPYIIETPVENYKEYGEEIEQVYSWLE
ncbi:deoxyribonuclease IV [Candidatus Contubernalis alkalaceticus]|nr:deoxyribonuclease IV [Candidatus Contubernalis alkalaceticus]